MFAEEVPSEKTIRLMNWWGWLREVEDGKTEAMFEQWLAEHGQGGTSADKKDAETDGDKDSPGSTPSDSNDSARH